MFMSVAQRLEFTMSIQKISGFVLFIIGVILLINGMDTSGSVTDRLSNIFTGHFTEATTWYIISGIASVVGGLMLFLLGSRKALV